MKKFFKVLLTILVIIGIGILIYFAEIAEMNKKNKPVNDKKILVVLFTREGENENFEIPKISPTETLANYIVNYTGADLFKIEAVNPYPESYTEFDEIAKKEKEENARPEIQNDVNNFSEYETIFLGYPIWWRDMPMIMHTFIENHDFTGKTVVPFNTHNGPGNAGTYESLKRKLPNSNVITNGIVVRDNEVKSAKNRVEDKLKELGF